MRRLFVGPVGPLVLMAALTAPGLVGCSSMSGEPAACDPAVEDCEARAAACRAAAERLAECVGEFAPEVGSDCDAEQAEAIAAADCETLREELSNADDPGGFSGFACSMGFYAACPEPTCVPVPGIAQPGPDDPCAEWIQFPGCGACGYYRCRERIAQCGPDGYLLGYGGAYCTRFATITERRVSPEATAWLGRVRRCLVSYLEAEVPYDATCDEIDQLGTDSHEQCYLETGFCDLSVADWFAIVHSIDPGDIPLRLVLATGHGCLRDWLDAN